MSVCNRSLNSCSSSSLKEMDLPVVTTHMMLAIVAVFYTDFSCCFGGGDLGKSLTKLQMCIVVTRAMVALFLVGLSVASYLLPGGYFVLEVTVVVVTSWLALVMFNCNILFKSSSSSSYTNSNSVLFCCFLLCLAVQCMAVIKETHLLTILTLVLELIYLVLVLLPRWDSVHGGPYQPLQDDEEEEEGVDLGVAKENASLGSLLSFHWVGPLIDKGQTGNINSSEDTFQLPDYLKRVKLKSESSLLRTLFKTFGFQFLQIGTIKFVSDCAGFSSPLLLNSLILHIEDDDSNDNNMGGYFYAICLAVPSLIMAICNTQFHMLSGELGLKVRAVLVTLVYDHTMCSGSFDDDVGEVVNYMSVDVERVINFGPNLHAAWSLPFQFTVTLVLLYHQVGTAAMAGVVLTVLMVPINKLVADNIGRLSSKMMSAKDRRVGVVAELLRGIRVVKCFVWEDYFAGKILKERESELAFLKGRKYLDAVCVFLWATTPVLISVSTFSLYAMLGNELTAAKVFTSMALFAMLTEPLNAFPWVINGIVEALVSLRRIETFISMPKMKNELRGNENNKSCDVDIWLKEAEFSVENASFCLSGLNLSVKKGEFIGVIGRVGSGKSSLLLGLLGELQLTSGSGYVSNNKDSVAYVQQEPWLQRGTVKDNILFGSDFRPEWFDAVMSACAIEPDLLGCTVGENGSMLSGGQRARVALARAVYQDRDVYLVDDVFAAVDAEVGEHIYEKCILGLLGKKTRVLCTHHHRYLAAADKVVLLEEGRIVSQGLPKDVTMQVDFAKFKTERKHLEENEIVMSSAVAKEEEEEIKEKGKVSLDIYWHYWNAVGKWLSLAILLSLALMQGTKNLTDVWLANWVSSSCNTTTDSIRMELTVYVSLAAANSLFSLFRAFLFAYGGVIAARTVHDRLTSVIMSAETGFFEATASGRILNRFSSDVNAVDDALPFVLNILLANLFGLFGPILVCTYATPYSLLLFLPMSVAFGNLQAKYRPSARDLKRVSSVALSPIYEHFSETLSGLHTIRAMRKGEDFRRENEVRLEMSQRAQYSALAAALWLEIRLQSLGCLAVAGIAVLAVAAERMEDNAGSAGFVGLAVSYALGVAGRLSGLVTYFAETEKQLVAVERCYQYIDQVRVEEQPHERFPFPTMVNWPSKGKVKFDNVSMRYREDLPLALDSVNFEIGPGEKVGVMGRTGSGKSSLFRCLFRMTPNLSSGSVIIDGVNVKDVDLRTLRRSLAIIPQEPFLFRGGSVRENLNPTGESKEDAELWETLDRAGLAEAVRRMGGLETEIHIGSFSMGQRQLLCLARAILSNAKVVCVDEATANVDAETDLAVQEVLSKCLLDRTVITVAHRTDTVMEAADRVVVLSKGRVVQVATPSELLLNKDCWGQDG